MSTPINSAAPFPDRRNPRSPLPRPIIKLPRPGRRAVLMAGLAGMGWAGMAATGPAQAKPYVARPLSSDVQAWGLFRERFLRDGRIVDDGNGSISHSEGQGVGLLAAATTGDRASFEQMLAWTRSTLARPSDSLHAWRYKPFAADHVDDLNNATDGDLMIAMALFKAARRWDMAPYHALASRMAVDIARHLVLATPSSTVLLPGNAGFAFASSVIVNPSYYIFPAIREISAHAPSPLWQQVWNDGLTLLRAARFGQWKLPPDWLSLEPNGRISLAERWPTRFSFDAVRVPLYMCWGGFAADPVVTSIHKYWASHDSSNIPAWVDLAKSDVAPYRQTLGMAAVRQYVDAAQTQSFRPEAYPSVAKATDYYSAALIMLVQLAMVSADEVPLG